MRSLSILLVSQIIGGAVSEIGPIYSVGDEKDPNLKEMSFDIGFGTEYFEAFMEPDIQTISNGKHDQVKTPEFTGHAVKFFNLSPNEVELFWMNHQNQASSMGPLKPFHMMGTASFKGHRFIFGPPDYETSKIVLKDFVVDRDGLQTLYYYDPLVVEGNKQKTKENLSALTLDEYEKYSKMDRNRKFAEEYFKVTGRPYMTMYPRDKPKHFMWPTDYIGQEHWVATRETHFKSLPSARKIKRIRETGLARVLKDDEPRLLADHRVDGEFLNMTLKVLSVRPRTIEISNFLSEVEVDHIVEYAKNANMQKSTVGQGMKRKQDSVRTSYNTWVPRETDQIFDAVYRRAADLLRIDEALFRHRDGEIPDWPNNKTVGEDLQLVHYNVKQEYTAHHDFGYADVKNKHQPARFATLLFYLNTPEEGGQTEFPRWVNGETSDGLLAEPVKGKAVLFYSFLPDGNLDDLSQHAAKPVEKGEKYLINLWIRDPIKDF